MKSSCDFRRVLRTAHVPGARHAKRRRRFAGRTRAMSYSNSESSPAAEVYRGIDRPSETCVVCFRVHILDVAAHATRATHRTGRRSKGEEFPVHQRQQRHHTRHRGWLTATRSFAVGLLNFSIFSHPNPSV